MQDLDKTKFEYIKLCPEKFWQPCSSSKLVEEAQVILYSITYSIQNCNKPAKQTVQYEHEKTFKVTFIGLEDVVDSHKTLLIHLNYYIFLPLPFPTVKKHQG